MECRRSMPTGGSIRGRGVHSGGALQRFRQIYVVDDVGLDAVATPFDLHTPGGKRVSFD